MPRHVEPTLLPREAMHYRQSGIWSDTHLATFGARLAASRPDAVVVVDRDRRLTFGEVDDWASVVAEFFRALGVRPREVVTFQIPNWAEALVVNQAILKIGAVANPVIPIYREHELAFILREAESAVYVVPDRFRGFDYVEMAAGLREIVPTLRHIVVVGEARGRDVLALPANPRALHPEGWPGGPVRLHPATLQGGGRETQAQGGGRENQAQGGGRENQSGGEGAKNNPGEGPAPWAPGSAEDPALLLYTSGTTASPKGAIHTHNTLVAENRSMIEWFGWTTSDVIFMPSPVTHITGYLYGLLLPFMLGTRVVLLDVWDAGQALRLVRDEGCTLTVGATPFLQDLIDAARKQGLGPGSIPLRTFACGGADVPPKLIEDACTFGVGAGRVYGSTEYPTYTCFSAASTLEQRATSDGCPMSGESRIVDDDGAEVVPGETGELLLRGPERCLGYLDAALNVEAFDGDGWFRTGDLVSRRSDGYFEVKGRKKDVVNRGGEKVSTKEVEDILYRHPLVREVAIVAMPDPRLSERACAYVVPADAGRPPSLGDLVEFLAGARVAKQKYPERIEIVPALPKTASGKVQKFVLREDVRRKLQRVAE